MFEGTWRGVICLFVCLCGTGGDICANVSSCVHSLVVTAGFPGWRRGKPSGWTNKQAASKGSYLPGQKHTGPLRYRKGGGEYVISVFLANCPVLVERKCSGYISFHHGMPPTVIKKNAVEPSQVHTESQEKFEGDPINSLGWHTDTQGSSSFY